MKKLGPEAIPLTVFGDLYPMNVVSALEVDNQLQSEGLVVAVVRALSVSLKPSPPELVELLTQLIVKRKGEEFPPIELKEQVRALLRKGGFKPSGRNKPASEYLSQSCREERFPIISNLVDINNYLSLLSGLPITLLDLASTGPRILVRFGQTGEKFVFNSAGQEIDLKGLITVCKADPPPGIPLGTPVKDSMAGKIKDNTTAVLGVIYAPKEFARASLESLLSQFQSLLSQYGNAAATDGFLV